MINYNSISDVLRRYGYTMSNTCRMDGKTYHDYNSRKKDASISLIVDDMTGSISHVEVTGRKWDERLRRYIPVKKTMNGLKDVIDYLGK